MNKLFLQPFFLLTFCIAIVNAQNAPVIEWQKCLGGGDEDIATSVHQTRDSGYIVAGYSSSNGNDVSGNHGKADYWVVKLDDAGNLLWQKSFGGSETDLANSIQQTADDGYILAGYSSSNNGDVSGNHGGDDCWIVKLDATGNITWQKSLGGSDSEGANSIQQTVDGGYIIAGGSGSDDGDVSGHHGTILNSDFWIAKLDASGTIDWQKSLGGTNNEWANSIQQTAEGGYIVAGPTTSKDDDVSVNHGQGDYWVVKLNSTGSITWEKSLGGTAYDYPVSIRQTMGGGFIVSGYTSSNNNDVSGNHGLFDLWVVKLDSLGNIDWQKSLGGTSIEWGVSSRQTSDGGFIVAGSTDSNDGDVFGNHGHIDYWIVKLDSSGEIEWQECFGGNENELAISIEQTIDGGYITGGWTDSDNGDVSANNGLMDYWIVKLNNEEVGVPVIKTLNSSFSISPNPAFFLITLQLRLQSFSTFNAGITITNILGQTVFEKYASCNNGILNEEIALDENFSQGMYFVNIRSEMEQWSAPLIVIK